MITKHLMTLAGLTIFFVQSMFAQGGGTLNVEFEIEGRRSLLQNIRQSSLEKNLDYNGDGKAEFVQIKRRNGYICELQIRDITSNYQILATVFTDSCFDSGWKNFEGVMQSTRFYGFYDLDNDGEAEAVLEASELPAVTVIDIAKTQNGVLTMESLNFYRDSLFVIGALDFDLDEQTEMATGNPISGKIIIWGDGTSSSGAPDQIKEKASTNFASGIISSMAIVPEFQSPENFRPSRALRNALRRNRNTDLEGDGKPELLTTNERIDGTFTIQAWDTETRMMKWETTTAFNDTMLVHWSGFFDIDNDNANEAVFSTSEPKGYITDTETSENDLFIDDIIIGVLDADSDGMPEALSRDSETGVITVWGTGTSGSPAQGSVNASRLVPATQAGGYQIEYESEPGYQFGYDDLDDIGDIDITDMNADGVLDLPFILEDENGLATHFQVFDGATGAVLWNLDLTGSPLNRNRFEFHGFHDLDADGIREALFSGGGLVVADPTNSTIELTPADFQDWRLRGIADIDADGFAEIIAEDTLRSSVIVFGSGTVTSVDTDLSTTPQDFTLSQNYPNPFNPETTITYSITTPGRVDLTIYDALGRHVRTLVDEVRAVGDYAVTWNGRDDDGRRVASGSYFYKFTSGASQATRQMILLK